MSDFADQIGSAGSAEEEPFVEAESVDVGIPDDDLPMDETAELHAETIDLNDNQIMRLPDASEVLDACIDISPKDLSIFCRTGLRPGGSLNTKSDDVSLVPAILYPYLREKPFRRSWPLVVNYAASGIRIESLRDVVDSLVEEIDEEGDAGELIKRALLRLELLVVNSSNDEPLVGLASVVQKAAETFGTESVSNDDRRTANTKAVQLFLSRIDENSKLLGYSEQSLATLLVATSIQVSDARRKKLADDIEWLITQLDDLLRVEEEDSAEGHSPEKLAKSVGGAYKDTIDFGSLSHLLDEAPHGIALDSARRKRIDQTLKELSEYSADLFSDNRMACFTTADEALIALKQRVTTFTQLFRARQIAQLEVENTYQAEIHDSLFESFEYESIPVNERKAFPPVLVHLHSNGDGNSAGIEGLIRALGDPGTMRILNTYSTLYSANAVSTIESQLASSVVSRGDVFVQQSTASQAADVTSGLQVGARARGSSVMTVFMGQESDAIDLFLSAGLAGDSRTVPSFRFDPENGNEWAEWFTASANEQPAESWPAEEVYVVDGPQTRPLLLTTTPADVLALDSRFRRHFVVLSPSFDSPALREISDYLLLDESSRAKLIPFIWTVDDKSNMLRAVVGPALVRTADAASRRWRIIQEWSGIDSSILRRGLLKSEDASQQKLEESIAEAQAAFDQQMSDTTASLAQSIVENIAASLLGLSSVGAAVQHPSFPVTSAATPPPTPTETMPAEISENEEAVQDVEEDDELDISLDEAYIDTPLCTSCNECTDLNGLIFAYDENKQAYIKDAAAGPFRDLVMAAEKCPVRIIHPGKPHDQSEKDLDDLVERAKAFT